jgi:iron complex transport system substrate-binding protein
VTAADGAVTVPHRPTRILSLSATATEMLYAIGAGPQVVAVDNYSTDPPNAPRTAMTGYETSAESYMTVHPDLVILAFDTGGNLVHQLAQLGVPALLLPPAKTIADTYQQFRELGRATGHLAAAEAEDAAIARRLKAIVASVGDRAKGLTYYQEIDNTLYTASSKTFIGALYARLGMIDIADATDKLGSGYPQLSTEYLIAANPDYVFLADGQCCAQTPATFAARPGFSGLQAVREHHVFTVPDPIASEWGPRVVDFLATIASDVAPGSVTPSPSPSGAQP